MEENIWNAISNFDSSKYIDYKMFSNNLKARKTYKYKSRYIKSII